MTSRTGIAITILALFAAPAMAAKVYIDYDKEADLEKYRTWAYHKSEEGTVQDPLMDERIMRGLFDMLEQGRLDRVAENPDLWVTYTVTSEDRQQYSTTSVGYGWGGGYGRYGRYGGGYGGVGVSTSQTTAHTYTDGTLIVDIWDARTKELVWRGTATDTLKGNPDKIAKQIDKFYTQMWDKWQKTIRKDKKDKK